MILTAPPAREDAPPAGGRRGQQHLSARSLLSGRMFVLIVGAGRVGSAVARSALAAGHDVSVLDEDPLSHERLEVGMDTSLGGRRRPLHRRHGARDRGAARRPASSEADVFIASTDGDNTNLVIAQIAQRRFNVPKVIVRVLDPARPDWYSAAGAAHDLPDEVGDRRARGRPRGGLLDVRPHRRRRQGRPQPRRASSSPRATRSRSSRATARSTCASSRSSSTPSSTATAPSCGCSSARGSSAPTSWSPSPATTRTTSSSARSRRRSTSATGSSPAATTRGTSSTSSCSGSSRRSARRT